jgi:hypothetical protein
MSLRSVWRRVSDASWPSTVLLDLEREAYSYGFKRRSYCIPIGWQDFALFLEGSDNPRPHASGLRKLALSPFQDVAGLPALVRTHLLSAAMRASGLRRFEKRSRTREGVEVSATTSHKADELGNGSGSDGGATRLLDFRKTRSRLALVPASHSNTPLPPRELSTQRQCSICLVHSRHVRNVFKDGLPAPWTANPQKGLH